MLNKGVIAGYDHYLLFDGTSKKPQVVLENSKFILNILTNYNSAVFYSDNNFDNYQLNNSSRHNRRGLAIEPQVSCMDNLLVKPGEKYSYFINYEFLRK